MSDWDAAHYLRFAGERTRPSFDLVARIEVDEPREIIDLGCGPGNSTTVVARRWPKAHLVGLDNSAAMIAAARKTRLPADWKVADLTHWSAPTPCDVVFCNASLQWVSDHQALIPRLFGQVATGGALAFQVPVPSEAHQLMAALADSERWRGLYAEPPRLWVGHEPSFYYDLLSGVSPRLDIWTTDYLHVLEGPAAVVDWFQSTGLRPFLTPLPSHEQPHFLDEFRAGIEQLYPRRPNGQVLFSFRRLFIIAYRPQA